MRKKIKKSVSIQKTLKISKKLSPKTPDTANGLSQHNGPDVWDRGSIDLVKTYITDDGAQCVLKVPRTATINGSGITEPARIIPRVKDIKPDMDGCVSWIFLADSDSGTVQGKSPPVYSDVKSWSINV